MLIQNQHYRTIWLSPENEEVVCIIDQRLLPHKFVVEELRTVSQLITAIKDMHVRGAGLIGATAGYGMYLACREAKENHGSEDYIYAAAKELISSRPTAINLEWAVKRQLKLIQTKQTIDDKIIIAKRTAIEIADEDAEYCRQIGLHGVSLIEKISKVKQGAVVNVLTHCNAGWLAFVDFGSALAPIYKAHNEGIKVHVWVDETRPRNQGASLTAWELLNHGVPHTIIADNTGGHLMQHGMVDMVITGADRVTAAGDVANKIGTYLKALAAKDNNIPFYVALPSSTFDWNIYDGLTEIEIETRSADEVKYISGICNDEFITVLVAPKNSSAINYGFDITPARLITGLITERGICGANQESIAALHKNISH
ncbi:MAG: S-methyl-5-thioribose-1-phosphate isomerase [bacterium]|nr:S-methyl-5-thioribose-1-phosphate isomerase [bacterium]